MSKEGLDLTEEGKNQIARLNTNLERMIQACMTLSQDLGSYEERLAGHTQLIEESLGPILMAVDEKLDRLDGIMDAVIEGSHSKNVTVRSKAIASMEKVQEIFEICDS